MIQLCKLWEGVGSLVLLSVECDGFRVSLCSLRCAMEEELYVVLTVH